MHTKTKVFISYHHENDQWWADYLRNNYGEQFTFIYGNSPDNGREIVVPGYIRRAIKEKYIAKTSITIVLCGAETCKRRYVDWELYTTLHHKHALLGIALPTALRASRTNILIPERLYQNIQSGYAHFIEWPINADIVKTALQITKKKGKFTSLINNHLPTMIRNLP